MNLTAVQLHASPPCRQLACGDPVELRPGSRGPVALFAPGSVVAYEPSLARRRRLFVFRTLVADDHLAAILPGVRRRVRLLLTLRGPVRIERLRSVFAQLVAIGWTPTALSDAFFLRIGTLLEGRPPAAPFLPSLLRREPSP
jgi:hypothetical protein